MRREANISMSELFPFGAVTKGEHSKLKVMLSFSKVDNSARKFAALIHKFLLKLIYF